MKVKLLKEVGTHAIGTILDVDATIVLQLEKDGNATTDLGESNTESKVYTDSTGKTYTEEEFSKIDKRTALYKEIINLSK